MVGGSTSGTVDLVVRQYASLNIEEVLGAGGPVGVDTRLRQSRRTGIVAPRL